MAISPEISKLYGVPVELSQDGRFHLVTIRRTPYWTETIARGNSIEAALDEARFWAPQRLKINDCTFETHRILAQRAKNYLRGSAITDARTAHWNRTSRIWAGRGYIGVPLR